MDVEKTMEFILQQQAKAETQIAAMGERQAKADKQIAAILKLIQTGMRMIVKQGESIKELREELREGIKQLTEKHKELAEAQRATQVELRGFIASLRRGGNGHRPKK